MAASMRPLTLGEILDRTVQLYRRNFLLFAGISILPSAAYVLVSGGAGLYFTSRMPALQHPGSPDLQAMLALALFGIVFVLVGVPLLLGISAVALSALTRAAFQTNRGDSLTMGAAYAYGFRHFWRHVGILFLQVLFAGLIPGAVFSAVLFGIILAAAVIAGSSASKPLALLSGLFIVLIVFAVFAVCIWIWLRYCLAFPAAVSEDKKAWPCLQRSAQLSKGTRGRIFVMYLMVAVLTLVVYYVLTVPIDLILKFTLYKAMAGVALLTRPPVLLQVVNLFINCLERTFVLPIYAIALLLFYNDQRTRNEGYDIEQLMVQAGWSELPPPTPARPVPALDSAPAPAAPPPENIAPEPGTSQSGLSYPAPEETGA
jgi:hypothetical protein